MGPDFVTPDTQAPGSFLRGPAEAGSPVVEGMAVDAAWWTVLNDPLLNDLVTRAAAQNIDVRAATERLQQSRAQRGIAAADLYPHINGDASYMREKLSDKGVISLIGGSGSSGGTAGGGMAGVPTPQSVPPFNVYQYGLDASWELDLWGRVRRGVEASDATVEASEQARREAALDALSELIHDYVELRGTQASLANARRDGEAAAELAHLTDERARAGLSTGIDTATTAAEAASTAAQIPQLEQQQTMLMNAIALLLAEPPGALEAELLPPQAIPPLPPAVPIGLPSELARRRPDVREAEAQLHAATAEIGVAIADFFPKITLNGNGMLQSLSFQDLNTFAAHSYTFGPSISLPIFEGGQLVSTLDLRNAQQREAALNYQKAVLAAFHDVDNALTAFRDEQTRRAALTQTVTQDREALRLATSRYKSGLGDYLGVLNAERSLLTAEEQQIQSTQTESVNMVQLYKALGGGW